MRPYYRLSYTSPVGHRFDLSARTGGPFVVSGGISGLVGVAEDVVTSAVGVAGQRFHGLNVHPMTGELQVAIRPAVGATLAETVAEFRQSFSRTQEGTLRVNAPGVGNVSALVRLRESIGPLKLDPHAAYGYDGVQVPLIADAGFWSLDVVKASDSVTVTNAGDVEVWPRIRWKGAGGRVTLPSGAHFDLPRTSEARTLVLDDAQSCVVVDDSDVVDRALWRALDGAVLPEGIPVGQVRTYQLPAGAELHWQLGFFDPFKQ